MMRSILCVLLLAWTLPALAVSPRSGFEPAPCAFRDVPADWAARNRVDCGWLQVPESRGKAGSRILRLWVAIARADAEPGREDPLLYIHGGPGYATVDYVFPYFPQSKTWPAFRRTRDIVFFDQRGTGRSGGRVCGRYSAGSTGSWSDSTAIAGVDNASKATESVSRNGVRVAMRNSSTMRDRQSADMCRRRPTRQCSRAMRGQASPMQARADSWRMPRSASESVCPWCADLKP